MPDNNDLQTRRREAKLAMGGEKIAAQEKVAEKRRQEARLAMEGEQQRARRIDKESTIQASLSVSKAAAEMKARIEAESQARVAKAAAERAQKEEAELTADANLRDRIQKAEETTAEMKDAPNKLTPLRTIKTDMARAVRDEGLSLSKIATLSQERGHNDESVVTNERSQTVLIISIILVLAVSGGLIGWFFISQPSAPVVIENPIPASFSKILQADNNRSVEATSLDTVSRAREALELTAEKKDEQGGLINIYFTKNKTVLTLLKFGQTLGLNLPEELTRHLQDNFVFGVYDTGEVRSRFLIFKTSFFAQAWSAMLDWERYMASDIGPLLKTASNNKSTWTDKAIRNKDARVQRDAEGNTILVYSFIDEQTLLITRDEETFIKVFGRLIEQG